MKKGESESMAEEEILPSDYAHSPAHHAVVLGDPAALSRLLSSLSSSPEEAELVLDRRDVPRRETPLHLAVRLGLFSAAAALAGAGADPSLQDAAGWTPLQTALALRRRRLAALLLRHHRRSALAKLRRRLPPLLAALRRIPDSYLEIHFRFESPLLPFLPRAAPSDTYRLWKRGADLRADTSLAGFDGLRVRRAPHTFLFLASSNPSLLVLDRSKRQIQDALYLDEDDDDDLGDEANAYRPGLDITKAELVPSTNWRRKERTEMVGEWKAKVYDVHNVVFSFKTLKAAEGDVLEREEEEGLLHLPLELDEESEEGFLVAELPPRHSCYERGRFGNSGREVVREERRRSLDVPPLEDKRWERIGRVAGKCKEKEMVKSLRPTVWLTEDFPLTTEEFLPLLDVLASKVKAVRRLRELLTTKFPPGTFPVKVAIPIVPTVRVVVTFTKFVDLQPSEQFFTPLSSPRLFSPPEGEVDRPKAENGTRKGSWLKWTASSKSISPSQVADHSDPFAIPPDYTWVSKSKSQGMKKTKSRKGKS